MSRDWIDFALRSHTVCLALQRAKNAARISDDAFARPISAIPPTLISIPPELPWGLGVARLDRIPDSGVCRPVRREKRSFVHSFQDLCNLRSPSFDSAVAIRPPHADSMTTVRIWSLHGIATLRVRLQDSLILDHVVRTDVIGMEMMSSEHD